MYTRQLVPTPGTGTPLLVLSDPFSVAGGSPPAVTRSARADSVFLRLSAAVTESERILIMTKAAEGGGHSGSDLAAVLTDSSKAWTVDGLIGKRVYNVTDGSHGVITDNDADTVTATLADGTLDSWSNGDRYVILDAEPRFLQAVEPSEVTDTEFLVALDGCVVFDGEVLEVQFANTDAVSLLAGSNVVYD